MNCRHCQQPIERCNRFPGHECKRYVHSHNGLHGCGHYDDLQWAEPEPGQPPVTETPASKPAREVA